MSTGAARSRDTGDDSAEAAAPRARRGHDGPGARRAPHPARVFVVVSLLVGLALVFVTPPFQVPDEPAHFMRAFAVSQGRLLPQRTAEGVGSVLPSSLRRLLELTLADVTFQPERRFERGRLVEAWRIELDPHDASFESYPTSAVYSALLYLPQALGILAGRMVSDRPLALLFAGRLANLAAATALIAFALARLPALRWFGCVLALAPMALFLRSSLSPDALCLALAAVTAALIAELSFARIPSVAIGRARGWALAAATALCLTKLPYAVLGLSAPMAMDRPPSRRKGWTILALTLCALAIALATFLALRVGAFGPDDRVDPHAQLARVAQRPLSLVRVVAVDFVEHGPRYLAELVGRLGWLDTPLPVVFLAGFLLVLVVLALIDGDSDLVVPLAPRGLLAALLVVSAVAISASQYVAWTPVGATEIQGVQGRYFLPLLPFGPWVCHSRRAARRGRAWAPAAAAAAILAAVTVTLAVLLRRYWIG